jgi:hypothetical protein
MAAVEKIARVKSAQRTSLAKLAKSQRGPGCLRLFFLLFFLIGAVLFYFLTIRPAMQALAARDWQKTPCVIESSQVKTHSSSDGSTYSVEVVYRYFCNGREYTSDRYHFATGSTSGRKGKVAIVSRYPPGTETYCYVNPAAPNEAVIERGLTPDLAFGAIGLVFALVGGLGMIFAGRLSGGSTMAALKREETHAPLGGPVVLKPKHTPLMKFLGMLAFAIIWNGFIGVFVYLCFFATDAKTVPFFAKAIVSLFALIGVAIVFGVGGSFLALFNPRIRLTAQTTAIPLGGELLFTWAVSGRTGMLNKLRVVFEGREEATYKRGTSTSTDTQVFAEIPVFETAEREFLSQGSARVAVPANSMHTFEGRHNKVLWRLKVHGEIPRWPDVDDEYPITVLPLPKNS